MVIWSTETNVRVENEKTEERDRKRRFVSLSDIESLLLVGIVITRSCFRILDGEVVSVAQFLKWVIHSVAATLIFQSTMDTPLVIKVVVQSQLLVSAGKGRPMHGRAELLSRPGGGLWNSARIVLSYFGSPLVIERQDYYSKYDSTPNRKKLSKEEYEQLTQETTREAMAGLAACPGFSD
ncbi:hypothetical protein DY000_02025137 [Brassica cretica]|uniref:Uncharacterized protein n=1 Tax=Brassica cretica TaxID=69181 RepID=A0ABQ7E6X1_BRACR|nr:hypothetical protein DY000_02025137 [Brassica cretica]